MRPVNWGDADTFLRAAQKSVDTDHYIDTLLTDMASLGMIGIAESADPLIAALEVAEGDLTVRSVALGLAQLDVPPVNVRPAIDALVERYKSEQQNEFLAPEILQALGVLAERSTTARAELVSLLMRVNAEDSRFLLIKAAKLVGRLESRSSTPGLRDKLQEILFADDFDVQAECRYQSALLALADALLEGDMSGLRERLIQARSAFHRAETSSESRPDASILGTLLDLMLSFFEFERDWNSASHAIRAHLSRLNEYITNPTASAWRGYQSPEQHLFMLRLLHMGDAFAKIGEAFVAADAWRNFDEALIDLASMYALISKTDSSTPNQIDQALAASAARIGLPSLGPLLNRVVGRVRLEGILESYKRKHGDDEILLALSALLGAALEHDYIKDQTIPAETLMVLQRFASRTGHSSEFFFRSLQDALEQGEGEKWARLNQLPHPRLPIDQPTCYGADSTVDETVRPLLNEIRERLVNYPSDKWLRLTEVVVEIVKFASLTRDLLPEFTVCQQDGGLGRNASEKDLQDELFYQLRRVYGNSAKYELTKIAGGRVDTGLEFADLQLPIEVKHEFDDVTRPHVRDHFVAQADMYATARDRVSILMILDLRDIHAAGHKTNIPGKRARKQGAKPSIVHQLYRLQESFWVESLPSDPHIPDAQSNTVIIALIPGNLPMPSGLTVYSRRR